MGIGIVSQTERFDDTHFLSISTSAGTSTNSSSSSRSSSSSSSTSSSSTRLIKPGDVIGGTYILKSLLGQGGMGYVFRAQHNIIKKDYALKIIRPDKLDDFSLKRFEIEGRVIAKLDHPNIVKIYNMGIDQDNCPYYVMDLLPGLPLSEYINRDDGLTFEQCLDIFYQVAQGLDYAHKKGIVHRDIKPGNFIMLEEGEGFLAKIVDFGLAKVIKTAVGSAHSQSITAKGQVFGSPYYMSPEQCQGEPVDQRSDIYSLGCALYESVSGEPPFIGANAVETLMMHTDAAMPKLAERFSEGPALAVDSLLAKMTAKNPADRYQSMAEVASALDRLRKRAPQLAFGLGQTDDRNNQTTGTTFKQSTVWTSRADAKWLLVGSLLIIISLALVSAYLLKDKLFSASTSKELPPEVVALQAFGPIKSHSIGSSGAKIFEFPEYCIGEIIPLEINKATKAIGTVSVAHGDRVAFSADEYDVPFVFQYPQIFEQLGKSDFFGLELKARGSMVTLRGNKTYNKEFNSDGLGRTAIIDYSRKQLMQILKIVSRWTNLNALTLDGFSCDEQVWSLIEKLPHLKIVIIKKSNFDVQVFANQKFLSNLVCLRLQDPLQCIVDPVLSKLAGSANLVDLNLDDVEFATSSFSQLKRCPNLQRLGLNKLEISDGLIKAIGEIKSLRSFISDGTRLTDGQLKVLAKMRNLKVTLNASDYFGNGSLRDQAQFNSYKNKYPTIVWH